MGEDRHLLTGLLVLHRSQRGIADRLSHTVKQALVVQPQLWDPGKEQR